MHEAKTGDRIHHIKESVYVKLYSKSGKRNLTDAPLASSRHIWISEAYEGRLATGDAEDIDEGVLPPSDASIPDVCV